LVLPFSLRVMPKIDISIPKKENSKYTCTFDLSFVATKFIIMSAIELKIERKFGQIFIRIIGPIEHSESIELKQTLMSYVERDVNMVLDIKDVGDWSLNGLNAILMTSIKLRKVGGKLTLLVPKDHSMHEYLAITKMNSLVDVNIISPRAIAV